MKKFLLICVALLTFTTTAFAYKIGDIIVVGGEMGIVYAVTTDGQHGKVVSVTNSGHGNWDRANQWCAQYGKGWRMPSSSELNVIYKKREILNPILEENGFRPFVNYCWSSTENDDPNLIWVSDMKNGGGYSHSKRDCQHGTYFILAYAIASF